MSEAVRLRESLKEAGIKISYNDIILKTAAAALRRLPAMNCSLQDGEIITYSNINIGMAVALDEGLIVPVMNNVDLRSLEQINAESGRLGELAKTGGLTSEDLSGATFTVSNLGMYGLDRFTAIINEPESGILAVVVKPVCSLTLTYDHRVIDGAPAAEFLMLIKAILENPYRLI
jgi:pyruvate dehydrogenase E2 component (dihydrolipoamide acetyltransferase)